MSNFIINLTYGGETGTINPDVGFKYSDKLNEVNEARIKLSGTGTVMRGLLQVGAIIDIYRGGTREFYGIIDSIDYLDGGAISSHASGYEQWLGKEPRVFTNSPWTSTASATIFTAIVDESSYLTTGTIEAGSSVDFRANTSESLWNAIGRLARKVQQDVQVDYPNLEIDILDHRGVATAVQVLNDGIQMKNLRVSFAHPLGNSIVIWGKGDGENQIKGAADDATSISTYGEIIRNVVDVTCITTADADKRADAELALTKDPTKIYDLEVVNPNQSLIAGDEILLNSTDKDLTNETVRIVGIEKGMKGDHEFLNYQVTNAGWSKLLKTNNLLMSSLVKESRENATYMGGSGNTMTWHNTINATATAPNKVDFYLSKAIFEDEAGNMRITDFRADAHITPYNKQFGTASESNKDPDVENDSSDNEGKSVIGAAVGGNTSITWDGVWESPQTYSGISVAGDMIIFEIALVWTGDDDETATQSHFVRIENTDTSTYYPNSTGVVIINESALTETFTDSGSDTVKVYRDPTGNVTIICPGNPSGDDFEVQIKNDSGSGSQDSVGQIYSTGYVVSEHNHGPGTYNAELHKHDVAVPEAATEDTTVNATAGILRLWFFEDLAISNNESSGAGVVIEMTDTGSIAAGSQVDFDGGVSGNPEYKVSVSAVSTNVSITCNLATDKSAGDKVSWNLRFTYDWTGTPTLIKENVDMSFNDTFPTEVGWWRMTLSPNSANADLTDLAVRIKHSVDN